VIAAKNWMSAAIIFMLHLGAEGFTNSSPEHPSQFCLMLIFILPVTYISSYNSP